ncbi:MAG: ABC transporter ATP-binding protein [Limnochordales bacterium]
MAQPQSAPAVPAIVVEGLVKRYGPVAAVDGISFTVARGETFGLLGPNGAGKTTTLEIIEGLRKPDRGRIVIEGIDALAEPERARALMGVQLQEAGLFDLLTVAETVRLFSRFHRRRVDVGALLERLQLTEKANARVRTLSGGQRQRLSIALALVNDPQVVFLDEPPTGLDPQARRNLWDVIRSIRDEGRTVVLTTHYMDEAEALCDRIAIVDQGRLIALDTPSQLIRRHAPGVKIHVTPAAVGDGTLEQLVETLAPLPGVTAVTANGQGEAVLYSDAFEETIGALVRMAKEGAIRYHSLRVEAANLEDVFLKLTGRRLRE